MKIKENALNDYINMIHNSWTYEKMTEKERKQLHTTFYNIQTQEALKGSYYQRWSILQAIYTSFLNALDYTPTWRETEEEKERQTF